MVKKNNFGKKSFGERLLSKLHDFLANWKIIIASLVSAFLVMLIILL